MVLEGILVLSGLLITVAWASSYAASPAQHARQLSRESLTAIQRERTQVRNILDKANQHLEHAAKNYVSEARDMWLHAVSIDEIRKYAPGVRLQPLERLGIRSIAELENWSFDQLRGVSGIGDVSALTILGETKKLVASIRQRPVPYPQLPLTDSWHQRLIERIYRTLHATASLAQLDRDLAAAATEAEKCGKDIEKETGILTWTLSAGRKPGIAQAYDKAKSLASELQHNGRFGRLLSNSNLAIQRELEFINTPLPASTSSNHFERNAADYMAVLEPYLGKTVGIETSRWRTKDTLPTSTFSSDRHTPSSTGGIPDEIAREVEAYPIRLDCIRPDRRLRKYQLFGAKYILAMERTILGDEMGLGKTVEALAAMGHLHLAEGTSNFLVICPAGVVRNWAAEVLKFTTLPSRILHGQGREAALNLWRRDGGVAVTSYDTFRALGLGRLLPPIALLVADEAHFIKNPTAARSRTVAAALPWARRVCFMSGTPIENRVSEFRNLATLLKPEVAQRIPVDDMGQALISPSDFQHIAAAVYLRRNQEDVLHELPEKIEVEEWVDLESHEQDNYRLAVLSRNLMAMRQAVTVSADGTQSSKMRRLEELLSDYRQSREKVIVFSFFHSVLEGIEKHFHTVGRIDGSISSDARLSLIEKLRDVQGHALLLSQIEAGGVGLNIQAASVVILMEPQWKPSSENQAIARVYRMGQARRVMVHRLLARESIDERLTEVLRQKQIIFDDHVRESSIKSASEEAISTGLAARLLEDELQRYSSRGA